jgi:SAM-dependent MidA family methyltransferase
MKTLGEMQTDPAAGAGNKNLFLQDNFLLIMDKSTLAAADPAAQQHSDKLKQLITELISEQGGWLSFADFMQRCLYQPGLGYYSAGSHKLGQGGDFTTAPETSSLFGQALATHIADAGKQLEDFDVLEFGAGSGRLAVTLLEQLSRIDCLPRRYLILETSADLQQRQQQLIAESLPSLSSRVAWLSAIPERFTGVILANEVADAMPVHLLTFTENDVSEQGVSVDNDQFVWQKRPLQNSRLQNKARQIRACIGEQPYQTEVNLAAEDWLTTVAGKLQQGAVFIVDYGYAFEEYYRPDRSLGTLRCYYRQQAHDNPLLLPGLQDITAHVDFSSLAHSAHAAGLDVDGFHEQADFLLAGDITQLSAELERQSDDLTWLKHSTDLKQLLLPGAMGHQFKILSLSRNMGLLPRLQAADRRYQL